MILMFIYIDIYIMFITSVIIYISNCCKILYVTKRTHLNDLYVNVLVLLLYIALDYIFLLRVTQNCSELLRTTRKKIEQFLQIYQF